METFFEKISNLVYCINLNKSIYTRDAISMAANKYADRCYIKLDDTGDDYLHVYFKLRYEINDKAIEQLIDEYCNDVLDKQIQFDLEERFGKLREIIYQKAFSPAGGIK